MKILHITEAYGGGVLSIVNQLANGMASDGHDVVLALSARPEAPPEWRLALQPQIVVREMPLSREINPVRDVKALLALVRLLKAEKPDVIHLHSSKAGFLGRVAAWLSGYSSKTFYSPHAFAYLAPHLAISKRRLYLFLEKVGALFGGRLIACSSDEFEEARNLRIKATVVNNALDLESLDEILKGVSRKNDGLLRVVTSGRVCAAKRPEFFVAVAEETKRRGIPCEFLWIGGGEPPPHSEAATFTGWKTRSEALKTMCELGDIYVQTSTYEGLPLSVLEAQAMGLPAVVTNAVGNRSSIVDGVTGFVSSSKSVAEFVDKVELLAMQSTLRSKLGKAARERIEAEFDVPLMLERYLDNYKSIGAPCSSGC